MRTDPSTIWANSRKNLLTTMGSSELADALPVAIRVNSFFSAKVAEARILDKLREVSDAYNSGSLGHSEARVMIKDFLGATSDKSDKSAQSDLSSLASTARLDLILNQQEAMFAAVGQYAAGMDPDVKERFPCWEYHVGPNARPEHEALDGLILNKDDEFWANHTPPWDFNCNCFLTNAEDPEPTNSAGKMLARTDNGWRVNGIDYSGNAPETGYMFNPAEALNTIDISAVKSPEMRVAVHKEIVKYCQANDAGTRIVSSLTLPADEMGKMIEPAGVDMVKVNDAFAEISAALKNGEPLPEITNLFLGKVLPEHAVSIGIAQDEMYLSSPGSLSKYGAAHWDKNHPDTLTQRKAMELLGNTIWNPAAEVVEDINGSNRRLVFMYKKSKKNTVSTMWQLGNNGKWEWQLVDSWEPPQQYIDAQNQKREKRKKAL